MEIYLSDFNEENFEEFYNIKCEKENIYWTNYLNTPNRSEFYNWCKKQLKNENRKILIAKNIDNNTVLGYGYIDFIEGKKDVIEISYAISSKVMGQGLGKDFVKLLVKYCTENYKKVETVEAWVLNDNKRSQRCLLSNNFKETNEAKKIYFKPNNCITHMLKFKYTIF